MGRKLWIFVCLLGFEGKNYYYPFPINPTKFQLNKAVLTENDYKILSIVPLLLHCALDCTSQKNMNPYKEFLDDILDNADYSVRMALDDWLEGLGPIVIPDAVAGRENRKPWKRNELIEDIDSLNVKENMNRISKNFCTWLRKLPGEDKTINSLHEDTIKEMFNINEEDFEGKELKEKSCSRAKARSYWSKIAMSIQLVDSAYKNLEPQSIIDMDALAITETKSNDNKNSDKNSVISEQRQYGAWYLRPKMWNKFYVKNDVVNDKIENKSKRNVLEANLTVKAFDKYLTDNKLHQQSETFHQILQKSS